MEANIKVVDPFIPFEAVHASRGKATRAEPVSALYEQGLIHHFGTFPELEDQMCEWVPGAVTVTVYAFSCNNYSGII